MLDFHSHTNKENAICNIDSKTGLIINENMYYSLGNHPWTNLFSIETIEHLLSQHKQIIAIGECGIDNIKSNKTLEQQITILKSQIKLSENLKLPLILHIVKGYNEIIKLKKKINPKQCWIIHGFNNYKQTEILLKNDFYLSFGKALLVNKKLQNSFKKISLEKIFFETDSSNLEVEKIYTFAAQLKQTTPQRLTKQVNQNLKTITNGKLVRTL